MTTEREAFEVWHAEWRARVSAREPTPTEAWFAACAWKRGQGESCARKPLAAQQLDALIERWVGGVELGDGEYGSMVMFAAAVEREHGIGIVETDGADKIRSGA